MKSRQEIKAIGKEAFKANYWNCVLVAVLVSAVLGVISWSSDGHAVSESVQYATHAMKSAEPLTQMSAGSGAARILSILLRGPLSVGLAFFYLSNLSAENREKLSVTAPFTSAFVNYPRKLGAMLLVGLKIFLWMLLLLIPGLIKSFAYAMTPYILAEYPNVKATDAIKLSQKMMDGHKWELFVLRLSYIGWYLLGILTLGILYVFHITPWVNSTIAVFYAEVRDLALSRGVITEGQLDGTEAVA